MFKKAIKMLRNAIIFLVIFGVMFSNIPFYVLSGIIEGYVKTANIVDRAWHLSQNDNVVDKFASYRNLLEKIKVYEAHAAINFVGSSTASGTSSAYNMSLTALTGGIASSPTEGDIVIAINVIVNTANGNPGVGTAGYTELVDMYRGDTYDTNLSVSYKVMGATPDTTVSCNPSNSGTRASDCVAMVFRGIDSATPIDVITKTASAGNSEDVNCPAITPVTPGAIVLCTGGAAGASVDTIPITPSGYTGTYIQTDPGSSGAAVASYKFWSGSGAEDPAAYVMDLGTASANSWAAATLALRPANNPPSFTVTQPDGTGDTVTVGDPYNITYDLSDAEEAVTAAFYYDTDTDMVGGTAISGPCATAGEGSGATCSWDTTGVTTGNYWVYGVTNDGVNPEVKALSPGQITINAFVNTLTIGVTAGSKVTTVNSGDSSVYANTTGCSAPASCAAFTLNVSNTSVTVGSIKITETGTTNATADLSQLALFYDTDGNYSNGVTGQYGGTVASFTSEAATVSGSLALTPATTYYFYVRFNASSTTPTYPKGGQTVNFQIAANADVTLSSGSATISGAPVSMVGTTTILPKVSSVSYGSGLSDGARSSEAITVSGYGFGVAPGGSRANCAGAVDTGCVRFLVGGATTVADASISSWSNTSIGWTVSSALATLGGASSLEVVSGSQGTATDFTYYIYPNITAITATAAREYDSGDVDGLVMLSGDHFGSTQGSVSSTGAFGNGNLSIHSTVEGSCTVGGWSAASYSGNTVCIEITPASISDSVYSGSITLNRNADSKTDIESNFSIMPRIISNTPDNGVAGDRIKITGNHFCQSGTCPVSPNRSTASNNVKFGSTQALDSDFVNSGASPCSGNAEAWTNTEICVKVPSGVPTGSQPTKLRTNNTYDSNIKEFTVNSTVPNDPADLNQYKSDGITQISQGGYSTSSTVVLKATSTASMSINMALEVEVKPTGVNFDETGIIQGPVCSGCTSTSTAVIVSGLSDGSKHWRARTKNTTTNSTSSWVCFVDCNINNADFIVDANAPAISGISSSDVSTNSATITWSTDEGATSQVQYNTAGSFVSNCATNNDCTALDLAYVTSHNVNLSNLDSGIRYYYRVRSKDIAGNEAFSSGSTYFDTTSVGTVPAKTVIYYAYATTSVISAGATASTSFSIFMPETSASTTSAFLELTGLSLTSGINNVWVQVNSQTAKTYAIASNKNSFKIIYKIDGGNINIEPTASSTVYINPSIDTYIASSRIVITYKYTP